MKYDGPFTEYVLNYTRLARDELKSVRLDRGFTSREQAEEALEFAKQDSAAFIVTIETIEHAELTPKLRQMIDDCKAEQQRRACKRDFELAQWDNYKKLDFGTFQCGWTAGYYSALGYRELK